MKSENTLSQQHLAEPLSKREREILGLLAKNLTNREIADALTVALSTIKWYTKQIYNKMAVNSRQEAVARANTLGLLKELPNGHHLPVESTRFYGREKELGQIHRSLLNPDCRMLTLVGLGGIGKTRLAIQAAYELTSGASSRFRDGLHFIPLADHPADRSLSSAIATILDFPLLGSEAPFAQLLNYLSSKQMLLILDNFEHLIDRVDEVSEILVRAPRCRLLITSREALNLQEEWRFEVGGLEPPKPTAKKAGANQAVQLFVDRASHVRADFDADKNATCIAHICRLLHGMPLAIELAASWTRSLSCQEIAGEIETSIASLEASLRSIPQRHQSIGLILEQTWSLMSDVEQEVYSALSVFSDGFTLAAAQDVAAATPAVLTSLVDKTLVRRVLGDRYALHNLLQRYAAQQLANRGQMVSRVRERHGAFFSELAFSSRNSWGNFDQLKALNSWKNEFHNMAQAWQWNLIEGSIPRLDKLIISLCEYLFWQGRLDEGLAFCRSIHERFESVEPETTSDSIQLALLRAKAYLWESHFTDQKQNPIEAIMQLDAAQALLDTLDGDSPERQHLQALVWLHRGRLGVKFGQHDPASRYLSDSLSQFRSEEYAWGEAAVYYWMGVSHGLQGNQDEARVFYEKAVTLFDSIGDRRNIASAKDALAVALTNQNELDHALDLHLEAIDMARDMSLSLRVAWMLFNLSLTYLDMGDFVAAEETSRECIAAAEELGTRLIVAAGQVGRAESLIHLGQYELAQEVAEESYAFTGSSTFWQHHSPLTLGCAHLVLGKLDRAYDLITESLHAVLEARHAVASEPYAILAIAALYFGRVDEANELIRQSLSLASDIADEQSIRRALIAASFWQASQGDMSKALDHYRIASDSPYFLNSLWYRDLGIHFLGEDFGQGDAVSKEGADQLSDLLSELARSYLEDNW
ncbi:MAG: tetratricopeptide repeat protein [Candidatus Promineifilaceae bacterium]